jgi:sugar phosphate isomerase/epimerase
MIWQPSRRTVVAGLAGAACLSSATRPMRLGGPSFLKSQDPRELAREHRRLGYSAAYCPAVKPGDTVRAREIEKAFAGENVVIAEVGVWVNMLDPDPEKRRVNLRSVADRLAIADEVGARCCVDIAGSYHPKVWYAPHPDNLSQGFFDATVENCRRLIDEVKPKRTKFTLEMMGWCLPEGPDSYRKLILAIDRKAFGVHLDVCNAINCPERFYRNAAFIAECFRVLGPYIVSCHAKDLEWVIEMNVHFMEVVPGRGGVDYRAYLRELSKLEDVPLMMEHLKTAEEYEEAKKYIQQIALELGLEFA